jgi:hypothetical protein
MVQDAATPRSVLLSRLAYQVGVDSLLSIGTAAASKVVGGHTLPHCLACVTRQAVNMSGQEHTGGLRAEGKAAAAPPRAVESSIALLVGTSTGLAAALASSEGAWRGEGCGKWVLPQAPHREMRPLPLRRMLQQGVGREGG